MTTVSICPITILYLSQYASTTLDLEAKDSTTHPETKWLFFMVLLIRS